MGQSQSIHSISNGSPSDSLTSSSASSNSALSELDGLVPTLPPDLIFASQYNLNAQVEHLAIYKRPLNGPQDTLTHHFLIVKVAHIQNITDVRYIKAEKYKDVAKRISITCGHADFVPAGIPEKHGLAMEGCGMIPVQKLTDILREPNSKYSLLKHNCWEYADETFRLLIEEFSKLPETTSEAKQRLQGYLAELPPLQLPGQAFDFHWAWVVIALKALLTGASVFGHYSYTAAAAATAATVPKLIPVLGLGHALPVVPTFATSPQVFLLLASAKPASVMTAAVSALPHGLGPTLISLLKHVLLGLPLKKFGILAGAALALCPKMLVIVIGVIGGVASVLGLSWVIYKILRGIAGNLRPDSGLSRFLDWVESCFASMWSGLKRFCSSCFSWIGPWLKGVWGWINSWFTWISSWFARPTEGTLVVAAH
ncbi:unnamed protein product [Calypogeia fissa]